MHYLGVEEGKKTNAVQTLGNGRKALSPKVKIYVPYRASIPHPVSHIKPLTLNGL